MMKTDAKFYAVHVSPSEKELQAMGTTGVELRMLEKEKRNLLNPDDHLFNSQNEKFIPLNKKRDKIVQKKKY